MENEQFNNEVQSRTCGECTLCCFSHAVSPRQGESFNKEAVTWCEHCAIGIGCKIYENRPIGCREFKCGWLTGLAADDERPDRTHVVMHRFLVSDTKFLLRLVETAVDALNSPRIQRVIQEQVRAGDLVGLHYLNGAKEVIALKGISIPFRMSIELREEKIPIRRVD